MLNPAPAGLEWVLTTPNIFSYPIPGLCSIISVEVMRQSVKRMIESEDTIWIEYSYAWSFACACAGFVLLFLTGIALLLLSMPHMPRNPWESCADAEPEVERRKRKDAREGRRFFEERRESRDCFKVTSTNG